MDNTVLRKRITTFKSSQGHLRSISNEVILEVLQAWEQWPGSTADFYRDLGIKKGQLSSIIRRAKKLIKEGASIEQDFKEVEIDGPALLNSSPSECCIELVWDKNKIIRFRNTTYLLDFLNKAA